MKRVFWVLGVLAILLALSSVFVASSHPDGLERVAEDMGFVERASERVYAPLPDYTTPGLGEESGGMLAGLLGVLATALVAFGLGYALKRRSA